MKKTIVRTLSTTALFSCVFAGSAMAATYKVQKGDSLSKIASDNNTSVENIKKLNDLSSDRIYVNQTLQLSSNTPTASVQAVQQTTYKVVSGDALIKVANRFHVSVGELQQWNGLKGTIIYVGQTLKVSAPGKTVTVSAPTTTAHAATAAPATKVPAPSATQPTAIYTVKSGDCLSEISSQFGMTVAQLKTLNNLRLDLIYVGQTLKVYAKQTSTPALAVPAAPAAKPQAANPTGVTSNYIVKSGDTLGKIAITYDMTVQELKSLNHLTSDRIYVGQSLKVTGTVETVKAPAPVTQTDAAGQIVSIAKSLIGTPYVWGGSTASGFDCSGFIYYVANKAGKSLPRTSAAGYYDRTYYVNSPKAGDIVFFENTYKQGISHLGIYLNENQFIHADEKHGIMISNLHSPYYTAHFAAFKRFY
ncbi:LysM peptidoglycan-binding domain-containing protein [Bacillus sp. ISL-18]|uniref:C40 family peptidase n=1 Tax=Bacillus sp. ISL-18 TaxID=2819118 RepID=UPI001BECFDA8|nr:peptidoglycan endopeptidase [Bacillus sp. ISL-18]MBT2659399.1 LysM peptidoglycan-binding domain-containing protein [Bacillus sp. ISL-18]